VGNGGEVSLTNTTDADILEYILSKLAARIAAKFRTFLVKVKSHRGEPLNEGVDDLTETDRTMEKRGTTTGGKNGKRVWCIHTTTGTQDNGKKTHGPKPFEIQLGEGCRNLYRKSDCSLVQTNGGRDCSKDVGRTWRKISLMIQADQN